MQFPVQKLDIAQVPRQFARETRVSEKVLYGIGEIPITVAMVFVGLFVLFFYNSVMKLPGTLVGIAGATGLLWDAAIDPYIGYRSDISRTRLGRRHGYMLAGCPAMGICFWLMMSPPQNLGTTRLFLWLLGTTVLFRLASALYRIPYLSLGAELSQDYQGRTTIVAIRSFFGLCGTLAATSLSFVLFLTHKSAEPDPKLSYPAYEKLSEAFGLVMIIAGFLATFGTFAHRSCSSSSRPLPGTPSRMGFWSGFKEAFQIPDFRRLWLSFTFFFFAIVFNGVMALHYFTWYARITGSNDLSLVQASFYLGALGGILFWLRISRNREKKDLCLWGIGGTALLMCAATLLVGPGRIFGTGNPRPVIFGHALAGIVASALWVLPSSMLADIVDQHELRTGVRREGVFFGIQNLGEKIAAGASLLLGGILLDYFVRLVPGAVPDASASFRIALIYGLFPGLLLAVPALLFAGYRLDRKTVIRLQLELRQRGHPIAHHD